VEPFLLQEKEATCDSGCLLVLRIREAGEGLLPAAKSARATWPFVLIDVGALGEFRTLGALRRLGGFRALREFRTLRALGEFRTLRTLGEFRALRRLGGFRALRTLAFIVVAAGAWRMRRSRGPSTWLAVMTEPCGELFKVDALVVIRIQAAKDGGYALGISAFKGGKGSKLVGIEASIITRDFCKFFFALGFESGSAGIAGSFSLFSGELAVTIRIKFRDMGGATLGTGIPAGFLGGLALFFVNFPVFVEVKLRKHFRQFAVTEGSITAGIGQTDADGKHGNGEVFKFHNGLGVNNLLLEGLTALRV